MLVDRDPLVRQRIDQGRFRREGAVEEVAIGKPLCFRDRGHGGRFCGKIQRRRWLRRCAIYLGLAVASRLFAFEIEDLLPSELGRFRLAVFPPVYGRKRNPDLLGQPCLCKRKPAPDGPDAAGEIRRDLGGLFHYRRAGMPIVVYN